MANATPQNVFNVQLTRSQLELLDKMLDQEIGALESGYAHPSLRIFKLTYLSHLEVSSTNRRTKIRN